MNPIEGNGTSGNVSWSKPVLGMCGMNRRSIGGTSLRSKRKRNPEIDCMFHEMSTKFGSALPD
jgi:hypothetical protein